MLNGFFQVGKGTPTRALMAIVPKDTKEPTRYLNLAPGERKDDVELVSIRLKDEAVDIVNEGTAMTLTIKSNSFASTATAPPPGAGAPESGGKAGFQRPLSPGFQRSMPVAPVGGPGAPVAAAAAAPAGGGAIIIGGGNSGSQNSVALTADPLFRAGRNTVEEPARNTAGEPVHLTAGQL